MCYLHPMAVQAKDVIQLNKIMLEVVEYPHLSPGPLPEVPLLTLARSLGREKGDGYVQLRNVLDVNSRKAQCLVFRLTVLLSL